MANTQKMLETATLVIIHECCMDIFCYKGLHVNISRSISHMTSVNPFATVLFFSFQHFIQLQFWKNISWYRIVLMKKWE